MFVTERRKSENHVYLEVLATRAELDVRERRVLERYRSGFEGEREYDAVLDAVGHGLLYVFRDIWLGIGDRKSTRLNSSHVANPYAVFCLKKKRREIVTFNL